MHGHHQGPWGGWQEVGMNLARVPTPALPPADPKPVSVGFLCGQLVGNHEFIPMFKACCQAQQSDFSKTKPFGGNVT